MRADIFWLFLANLPTFSYKSMLINPSSNDTDSIRKYYLKTVCRLSTVCTFSKLNSWHCSQWEQTFLKSQYDLCTLTSLISTQQILFFLRKFSHLHALLEPTRLFIFRENSYLHDY